MRVLCSSDNGAALPPPYCTRKFGLTAETAFPLTPGREYVVYAVAFDDAGIWYFVIDDLGLWYPVRYPASLFRIIDAHMPSVWRFAETPGHSDHVALLAAANWANDRFYYDRLTDRDPAALAAFGDMRARIDAETGPVCADTSVP